MLGGSNGPSIYNGEPYTHSNKTLLQLYTDLMIRLGFAAQLAAPPPGMSLLLNHFLADSQEQMYLRYVPLRTLMWWPIAVQAGQRFYDIPSISTDEQTDFVFTSGAPDTISSASASMLERGFAPGMVVTVSGSTSNALLQVTIASVTATLITAVESGVLSTESGQTATITTVGHTSLDHRRVKEAWLLDDTRWFEMKDGIDSGRFNETGTAFPQEYEFRNQLEIWPIPDQAYTIWLKGHFGLQPFSADTDRTTIDHKLVFLMALATAKAHYGQNDSGTIFRQLEVALQGLNKQDFGTRRFIPRSKKPVALAEPMVTFSRP